MKNFKITDSKEFRGLPKSIASTKNQVVAPLLLTFSKGDTKRGQDVEKIYVSIKSRVYIDVSSHTDTINKETSLKEIEAQVKEKAAEHQVLIAEYNQLKKDGKQEEADAKAKESRAKHQEAIDLEPSMKEIINTIDANCYYQHSTEVEVSTIDELLVIDADLTAAVKNDSEFKDLNTVDL